MMMGYLFHTILVGIVVTLSPCKSVAFFFRSAGDDSVVTAADSLIVTPETIQDVMYSQELQQQEHHRSLQNLSNVSFVAQNCNSAMSPCDLYSAVGASYTSSSGILTIPCGKCVTMDVTDSSTLTFSGGMRIIGKLDFPNNVKVVIKTPSVIVEGELSMESTDAITGSPKIKFILIGTATVKFIPNGVNAAVCGSLGCDVGPKAIVVAGGTLNVKGISDTCPTVAYVTDMGLTAELPVQTNYSGSPVTDQCPEMIIQQNFDAPDILSTRELGFTGGMGAIAKITNGSYDATNMLVVGKRFTFWQGPTFDATSILPCLSAGVTILFSAKVKLLQNGTDPDAVLARCKSMCCNLGTGNACPALKITFMAQDARIYRTPLVLTSVLDIVADGRWFPLTGQFKLNEFMVDPTNVYVLFTIAGVEKNINIFVDDIVMKYPPPGAFPTAATACSNLAFGGDAELLPVLPFPMYSLSGGLLRTVPDPTSTTRNNHVFKLAGRSEAFHGLAFEISPECVPPTSVYFFSARFFLNNTLSLQNTLLANNTLGRRFLASNTTSTAKNPDVPLVMMKKKANNQTTFLPIATCPPANVSIGWVKCQGFHTFKEGDNAADSLQISFMMMTDQTSDMLFDDVSFTYVSGGVGTPIFNNDVGSCWGPGANVYMASHGINTTTSGVVKIMNSTRNGDNTTIRFNVPVDAVPLSTSTDFATEFALTSRNIQFESEDLNNPANGATLTILSTPQVPQLLQGVTFNGFGQQGLANRFPILFKSCSSSTGSIVSKNSIINSNQRCIVLQGTNGVIVKNNVAYNTSGHCYALEDGSEVDNRFEGNFGASTNAAKVLINGESDNYPATFLITNPNNHYIGNIAAGSVDTGFFFNLNTTVIGDSGPLNPKLNPSVQPLGSFNGNVAHSNAFSGIKTSSGFNPPTMSLLVDSKVFRNRGNGLYLQGGQHITVQGGIFADNRIAISVNYFDDVLINGTTIIGYSQVYENAVVMNRLLTPPCPPMADFRLYGIRVNANAKNRTLPGTTVSNVVFSKFDSTSSCPGFAIGVSELAQIKSFSTKLSLQNLNFGTSSNSKISICDTVLNAGINDVVIGDSGSLDPLGNSTSGLIFPVNGTAVGLTCTDMPGTCAKYCKGGADAVSASDQVTFSVTTSFSGTETVVVDILLPDGNAITVRGSAGSGDAKLDSLWTARRVYVASVPPGTYVAHFTDDYNKMQVWPAFGSAFVDGLISPSFTLEKPATACVTIIPNGDFTAPLASSGWYHKGAGLQYVTGNPGNALSTVKRVDWTDGLGTFLDSRCTLAGASYEVSADVKIVLTVGGAATCDPLATSGTTVCPRGSLIGFTNGRIAAADWGVGILGGPITAGWNTLYGVFTIKPEIAAADQVFFQIERAPSGVEIQIDNVYFKKINVGCNSNMVKNSGVDYGNFAMWGQMGKPGLKLISPGAPDSSGRLTYYALSTVNRTMWHYGPSQDLDVSCFNAIDQYVVEMDVKMQETSGADAWCNPYQMTVTRPDACPMVFLKITKGNDTKISSQPIATTFGPYNATASKWRKIYNVFKVTPEMSNATALGFFVGTGVLKKNIVIDNVVMRKASFGDYFNLTCSNLIRNGDFTIGDARFYAIFGEGNFTVEKPGADGTGYALVHKNRNVYWHGPVQKLDTSCWKVGEQWSFEVKMKIKVAATGAGATCDKAAIFGATWCPTPIIYSVNPVGNLNIMSTVIQSSVYSSATWDANGWNAFKGTFVVTTEMATYPYVWGYIGNEIATVDLYLDDWSIKKFG